MRSRLAVVALGLVVLGEHTIAQNPTLRISGRRSIVLSAADLSSMPRGSITTTDRGEAVTFEGVPVRELLSRVDVPVGEALRGPELAQAVVVTGADGYRVAFGIAEFDSAFTDRIALLADRRNGAALRDNAAPFQLVLTGEKRPARWVRQVVAIDVVPVPR